MVAVLATIGCHGGGEPIGDDDDDTTPAEGTAACTAQPDNVLRFDCTVNPGPARIRVLDGGAGLATWESETDTVTVWGLRPNATYGWEALDAGDVVVGSGELTTGALPRIVDVDLAVTSAGEHQTRFVLFNLGCGTPNEALVIASAEGDVIWYQESTDSFGGGGFSVTPEGTILGATKQPAWVGEWDLAGNLLLDLSLAEGELSAAVHHDVVRGNGLTYVVNARPFEASDGLSYAMDGFDVIDGGAVVASWNMEGLLDPTVAEPSSTDFWGGLLGVQTLDWAHANAIAVDGEGAVYLSLRYTDSVLKIAGDPADPEFGAVRWMLVGDDDQPYPSDLARISSAGLAPLDFEEQHHVWVDPSGDLMMWDNRSSSEIDTRALRFRIDEGAGTADLVEAVDAGAWCPGQGSAFVLPGGNLLTDCMTADRFTELTPAGDEVWRMEPTCRSGELRFLYRAAPIEPYP